MRNLGRFVGVVGWVVVAGLAVSAGACSSSKSSTKATGAQSGLVDASGGTITFGAATLVVPAGALSSPTTITISEGAVAVPSQVAAWTAVYELQPQGLVFKIPATLSLAPSAGAPPGLLVYLSNVANDGFDALPTTLDGTVYKAGIAHFSNTFLASESGASDGGAGDAGKGGGGGKDGGTVDGGGDSSAPASCTGSGAMCSVPDCSITCSAPAKYAVCSNASMDKMGACNGPTCACTAFGQDMCTSTGFDGCTTCTTGLCVAPNPYAICTKGMSNPVDGCIMQPTCTCSPTP